VRAGCKTGRSYHKKKEKKCQGDSEGDFEGGGKNEKKSVGPDLEKKASVFLHEGIMRREVKASGLWSREPCL